MDRKDRDLDMTLSREKQNGRRILSSARDLFIEYHGADNVNMHQIAKAAGVGQATLYRRYTGMGDICTEIVREESQPLFNELNEYLKQNEGIPPLERLSYVIKEFAAFLDEKKPWLCAISRTVLGYGPMQSPVYQWMRDTCRVLYNEADQRRDIFDVDIPYTIESLLSTLHNIDFHLQDHDLSMERIVRGLHRIFIEGLKK